MMKNVIYICHDENAVYPSAEYNYSPSIAYPEYQFTDISDRKNYVYDMVRVCFVGLKLDIHNYGTDRWNPLGEFIRWGDKVLIKPNLVRHTNPVGGIDCLITHPSILRPIVDYVLIALNGTGSIVIGDAPVQSCDFQLLYSIGGYDKLINYYKEKGIDIAFEDFRGTIAHFNPNGTLTQEKDERNISKGIIVNIGQKSAFTSKANLNKLRITNYAPTELLVHHENGRHEYLISDEVLNANVIINVPKPKTHRKAGITGALKNIVGINVEKEFLPHHTKGSKDEGGDEYLNKNCFCSLRSMFIDKRDNATYLKRCLTANIFNKLALGTSVIIKIFHLSNSNIKEGNWYGNDTIWRTILDLNNILRYADAEGNISEEEQRRIFTIADMIVSGEGDGPLSPRPNPMGTIVCGSDSVEIDKIISTLMGIDFSKIPSIEKASKIMGANSNLETIIKSNIKEYETTDYVSHRHVKMPQGWENI